ncbi:hypothetical protein [Lysinibacter sp. HNR]|uniref:hypothetical protein n=1 Tax=Lysinibacter sp. HNR TaxID=3031408 RepID=UPI002435D658|nr:hypothetical protein [Lysinibacter sp. HNR]WGD36825.1 hypothetical protein FrondiHNR_10240 [Lysinibacter sp. HNR]
MSDSVLCARHCGGYATEGLLCRTCWGRILWQLDHLPALTGQIRDQITPRITSRVNEPVSGTKENPLPFRLQAMEDSSSLFSQLCDWAVYWAGAMGIRPAWPLVKLAERQQDAQGIPTAWDGQKTAEIAGEIARWLVAHHPSIVYLPAAVAYHDDLVDLMRRYGRRYQGTRRLRKRMCVICLSYRVTAVTAPGGKIAVQCEKCGADYPMEEAIGELYDQMVNATPGRTLSGTQQTDDALLGGLGDAHQAP